ncbi:hypothetical protein T12_7314 [Trichinella patagoniensis]|uniref:Uncharacterized protein n=1 Tax=Trichinella patagoniensis TaxID=990121 RepID=A0A0V1AC32_9BILA|nr:hypothetical protein T12_7314 [Trichinella patagoniensis]
MKLQKQPVGWLVVWLAGWMVEKRVLETGYKQNPSMEMFLAVNKKTAWAISSQTHYLIDTAALESTEAEIRAVEREVDRGCLFVCVFFNCSSLTQLMLQVDN